ncbi:outer membrane protein transport protein [Myxococcota bacterium]|nr:outer membrane protein transport protein [Myxococcota bacterium]
MRRGTALAVFLLCSLWLGTAFAQAPQDLFGLDTRGQGTAGASLVTDPAPWAAALHNPAALGDLSKMQLGWAYGYGYFGLLQVNAQDAGVLDARGVDLGLALPLGRFWKKLPFPAGVGLSLHIPDQFVVRMQAIPASEPRYILLDNYPHRLETALSVGATPWKFLQVGFGLQMMVHLQGDNLRVGIGAKAGRKFGEMMVDTTIPYGVVPQGGVILRGSFLPGALSTLKLGLFWREPYTLRVKMNIVADVDITGVVSGDTILFLKMIDHYTPRKFALGASWSLPDVLDLYAGIDFLQWSAFDGGISEYRMRLDFGINPPLVEIQYPGDNFRDVSVPRAGLTLHAGPVSFSAGYAFVPTPVPAQEGLATLMDNDRHVLGLGIGLKLADGFSLWPHPLRLQSAFQYHQLVDRTDFKVNATLPAVNHRGSLLHFTLGFETEF